MNFVSYKSTVRATHETIANTAPKAWAFDKDGDE